MFCITLLVKYLTQKYQGLISIVKRCKIYLLYVIKAMFSENLVIDFAIGEKDFMFLQLENNNLECHQCLSPYNSVRSWMEEHKQDFLERFDPIVNEHERGWLELKLLGSNGQYSGVYNFRHYEYSALEYYTHHEYSKYLSENVVQSLQFSTILSLIIGAACKRQDKWNRLPVVAIVNDNIFYCFVIFW